MVRCRHSPKVPWFLQQSIYRPAVYVTSSSPIQATLHQCPLLHGVYISENTDDVCSLDSYGDRESR